MEERSLEDKVVVITGGALGIGSAIADNFLSRKAKVIILDINEKLGEETVKKFAYKYGVDKVTFIKCDVTTDLNQVVPKIFSSYQTVDVLVNNAGILNEKAWKKCVDINVGAVFGWTLEFWNQMRKDKDGKGGTIINIASIKGYLTEPYIPVYTGTKHAVVGFTKSLGHIDNFNKTSVRVVAVCPGFTDTTLIKPEELLDPKVKNQVEDILLADEFQEFMKKNEWQTADAVGAATVEVFEKADSGTCWLSEGGRPAKKISI